MSQHDFDIAKTDANTGASFRSEVNTALQALASNSKGTTEPAIKYPYQKWADDTTGYMKLRNGANTAWINLYKLEGSAGGLFSPIAGPGSSQAFSVGALSATGVTLPSGGTFYGTVEGSVTLGDSERLTGSKLEIRGTLSAQTGITVVTPDLTSAGCRVYTGASNALANIQAYNGNVTAYKNLALQDQGGNVLVGTTTDDGVNKLQVNGSGSFAGGINGTTALNITGYGGFFQGASKFGLDVYNGQSRLYASGVDTSNLGALSVNCIKSDGTGQVTHMFSGTGLSVTGGISASALPVYADNTAAAALAAGTMYRTATGVVMIKY